MSVGVSWEASREPLGGSIGASFGSLGGFWGALRDFLGAYWRSWEPSWGGGVRKPLRLPPLGPLLGSGALLGAHSGASWAIFWALLEAFSWPVFGAISEASWAALERWKPEKARTLKSFKP